MIAHNIKWGYGQSDPRQLVPTKKCHNSILNSMIVGTNIWPISTWLQWHNLGSLFLFKLDKFNFLIHLNARLHQKIEPIIRKLFTLIGNIERFHLCQDLRTWSIFYFDTKVDSQSALYEVVSKILKLEYTHIMRTEHHYYNSMFFITVKKKYIYNINNNNNNNNNNDNVLKRVFEVALTKFNTNTLQNILGSELNKFMTHQSYNSSNYKQKKKNNKNNNNNNN
ncbi:hypothetical protein AGLY_009333 [Aphis glycines]|uniref:Uncharacterized protein n=1 Tax=Aphis glycines TaxID=307491 RepID=A0A6G0TI60_APHGL|nr:hypothetical protein AGLY_009333 [Aphis glycines]